MNNIFFPSWELLTTPIPRAEPRLIYSAADKITNKYFSGIICCIYHHEQFSSQTLCFAYAANLGIATHERNSACYEKHPQRQHKCLINVFSASLYPALGVLLYLPCIPLVSHQPDANRQCKTHKHSLICWQKAILIWSLQIDWNLYGEDHLTVRNLWRRDRFATTKHIMQV